MANANCQQQGATSEATGSSGSPGDCARSFMLILLFTLLLYGQILAAPFYFDDINGIVDHYLLRDLSAALGHLFSPRGLTNLTLAINYRLSGFALPPLHLTNIAIHAGCGCLVFLLLRRWYRQRPLPLLGALLFIAHPLQTQAVTYLVQRAATLATFFFLLAVLLHLQARNALAAAHRRNSGPFLAPYLASVLAFALALLSKQNTVILPFLLMLHDRIFPQQIVRSRRAAILDYIPYLALALCGGIIEFVDLPNAEELYIPLASLRGNDPWHYLVTQFSVLWVYLRLLLFPYGQALEHNYPIVTRLLTLQNLLALTGLLVILGLAWRLRQRRPLLTFGVAWFFLGLAVESSLIPLDPLFEHRLYLPMFGFILVLSDLLCACFSWRTVQVGLLLMIIGGAALTWQRNRLWNDPIAFYKDNQQQAPASERVSLILANLYKKAGRSAEARTQMERLRRILPPEPHPYHQKLILFYAEQGDDQQARTLLAEGVRLRPQDPQTYKSGALYWMLRQQPQAARDFLQQGLAANPQSGKIVEWIGELALDQGDWSRAEEAFRATIRSGVPSASTYRNLSEALYQQGRMDEALAQLQIALLRAPGRPDVYEGLGRVAVALGDKDMISWASNKLARIDQESWQRLQQVIVAAKFAGD